MPLGETIVAISTPIGESAIAIIRISGPLSKKLVQDIFKTKNIQTRKMIFNSYNSLNKNKLDEVLYTFFQGPKSYTGEDMVEINCHGNQLILKNIIEDLFSRGCISASPGEFTRTAYLNGKMDLIQAEAVSDIISSKSELLLKSSQNQLSGALSQKINTLINILLEIIVQFEAFIDFPEENILLDNESNNISKLNFVQNEILTLNDTFKYNEFLKKGLKVVIVGAPNAGKSSLLNAILKDERAIVSEEPGTTRDFINASIMIKKNYIEIIDTAGLHETINEVELIGISKTIKKIQEANLFLLVIDQSKNFPKFSRKILENFNEENTILINNKIDLDQHCIIPNVIKKFSTIHISLKHKDGLLQLEQLINDKLQKYMNLRDDNIIIINSRHMQSLNKANNFIETVLKLIKFDQPSEIIVIELKNAMNCLGEITGQVDNDKILDKLFSTFCIGK